MIAEIRDAYRLIHDRDWRQGSGPATAVADPMSTEGARFTAKRSLDFALVLLSQKATVTGISESFMEANRTEATVAGMVRNEAKDIESRFTGYVEELVSVIGHADRAGPFRDYCTGLGMPGERQSVEPMAAITA